MSTLIPASNSIAVFAVLSAICFLAIFLEQRYVWASKLTGCIMVLLVTLFLANLKIVPTDAPAYDFIGGYLLPMALPLLLFKADIRTILKDSGRLVILFLIGAVGTCVGAAISYPVIASHVEQAPQFIAMITGSYIGGGINFVAMADNYGASGTTIATANVADALCMMFFFFLLMVIPNLTFFRKHWKHPIEDALAAEGAPKKGATSTGAYWSKKEISLKDIAFEIGIAAVIVAVGTPLAGLLSNAIPKSNVVLSFFNALLGSKYMIITLISVSVATIFSKQLEQFNGAQEIGTYFIYLFFASMSAPVVFADLVGDAPFFFIACLIILVVNIAFELVGAKLLKFGIEDAMICSNANIGGGTTAAAMAIAKNWESLILPGLLVGTLGNVIGNFLGILMGTIFGA